MPRHDAVGEDALFSLVFSCKFTMLISEILSFFSEYYSTSPSSVTFPPYNGPNTLSYQLLPGN